MEIEIAYATFGFGMCLVGMIVSAGFYVWEILDQRREESKISEIDWPESGYAALAAKQEPVAVEIQYV